MYGSYPTEFAGSTQNPKKKSERQRFEVFELTLIPIVV
jgi:hypothetical protein